MIFRLLTIGGFIINTGKSWLKLRDTSPLTARDGAPITLRNN